MRIIDMRNQGLIELFLCVLCGLIVFVFNSSKPILLLNHLNKPLRTCLLLLCTT